MSSRLDHPMDSALELFTDHGFVRATGPRETAATLDQIRDLLGTCERCRLCTSRTNIVFGVGDPEADLVVIGEAPGKREDLLGDPFVGRAGHMLNRMLANVLELHRDEVYILNVIKCRPPENRNPAQDEVERCLPFLEMQIKAIRPKIILLMGSVALRAIFQVTHGITRVRGDWTEWRGIPVMPTFHPAYLLRAANDPAPERKRRGKEDKLKVWSDLKELRRRYDDMGGKRLPS